MTRQSQMTESLEVYSKFIISHQTKFFKKFAFTTTQKEIEILDVFYGSKTTIIKTKGINRSKFTTTSRYIPTKQIIEWCEKTNKKIIQAAKAYSKQLANKKTSIKTRNKKQLKVIV